MVAPDPRQLVDDDAAAAADGGGLPGPIDDERAATDPDAGGFTMTAAERARAEQFKRPPDQRMPPQQHNHYDCGVYMLKFIEEIVRQMASAQGLPSFAEAATLVDHFSERMFSQEHIADKRRELWNVLREEYEKRHGVALGLDA